MEARTHDRRSDDLESRFGNRFLTEAVPDDRMPQSGMPAVDAMRLIGEELVLDGDPHRNLATFVTTWMEPEAQRIIAESLPELHRPRRISAREEGRRARVGAPAREERHRLLIDVDATRAVS